MESIEGNVEVDIEPGSPIETASECDTVSTNPCVRISNFDGLRGEGSEESSGFILKPGEVTCEYVQVVVDMNSGAEFSDHLDFEEKGYPKEKRLKPYSNKHCKPPRPPKGPLLNASDMLLVREISELAAKKRQNIEKIRALKKMKAAKSSSSGASIVAMVVTVVFFVVIILQGSCSRGGVHNGFQGSPVPSVSNKGLFSVQFYGKPPVGRYPNSEEPASGSSPKVEEGRDTQ